MTNIVETFFRRNVNPGWICEGEALRFAEVNDAALDRYGLTRAQFQALTLRDLQPGTSPHLSGVRMMRGEVLPSQDELLQHHFTDGAVLELTLRGVSIDIDARPYRLVISRDVTRRAAQDRQLAYVEREAARIARIGGWRFDTEARTFAYSAAARELLGLAYDDRGEPAEVVRAIAPEDRTAVLGTFESCVELGECIDRAFTVADRQGRPRALRLMAEPEFDLAGKVVGVVGVVQDMTGYRTRDESLSAQQALRFRQTA